MLRDHRSRAVTLDIVEIGIDNKRGRAGLERHLAELRAAVLLYQWAAEEVFEQRDGVRARQAVRMWRGRSVRRARDTRRGTASCIARRDRARKHSR